MDRESLYEEITNEYIKEIETEVQKELKQKSECDYIMEQKANTLAIRVGIKTSERLIEIVREYYKLMSRAYIYDTDIENLFYIEPLREEFDDIEFNTEKEAYETIKKWLFSDIDKSKVIAVDLIEEDMMRELYLDLKNLCRRALMGD